MIHPTATVPPRDGIDPEAPGLPEAATLPPFIRAGGRIFAR